MGSQNVTVKGMGAPPTIPTQVATGAMAELVSDPRLFVGITKNKQRNERLIFVLTFFVYVSSGACVDSRACVDLSLCLKSHIVLLPSRRSHRWPGIQILFPSTLPLIDCHFQAVCRFVHFGLAGAYTPSCLRLSR